MIIHYFILDFGQCDSYMHVCYIFVLEHIQGNNLCLTTEII